MAEDGTGQWAAVTAGNGTADVTDLITEVAGAAARMLAPSGGREVLVPGSDWTVVETAAHLVLAQGLFGQLAAGQGHSPFESRDAFFTAGANRSHLNAELMAGFTERDPATLAAMLEEKTRTLVEAIAAAPAGAELEWHFTRVGPRDFACATYYHLLGHVIDMARAAGGGFRLEARHTGPAIEAMEILMPHFVDTSAAARVKAAVEIRVRGGRRFGVVMEGGRASVQPGPMRRADCRISADPVSLVLVATGRDSQWAHIARGRILAWGRNPFVAFRLTSLFPSPG